jgi:hypothetical protein
MAYAYTAGLSRLLALGPPLVRVDSHGGILWSGLLASTRRCIGRFCAGRAAAAGSHERSEADDREQTESGAGATSCPDHVS